MTTKILSVFLTIMFFTADLFAASAGTTLFNFLKIPLNASQAGLAGISVLNDSSVASNPAVIPFFEKVFLSASYAAYFQDTSFNSVALTVPFKGRHGINLSYGGFDYGKMDSYLEDSSGNYVENGTFGASDAFFGISYGRMINPEIYAGAGLKYVWQTIDGSKIDGFVLSASGMYKPGGTWHLSGGLENVGPNVDGYQMPSSIYVSIADTPKKLLSMLTYGFELRAFFDETFWLKGAGEFNYNEMFFARLGYSVPLSNGNGSLGDWYERNLSAGFGVKYGFFSVDYAWLPFGDLGSTNMISLQIHF